MLSLFRLLFSCDCDETVLLELMITCTGLWLTCFVILFLYTRLLSFPRLLSTGLLLLHSKVICNFVPQGNAWLWLSLIFWRLKNLDFLYFAVSVPSFIQLRLWWNCASWIDDNMHWALIDLFCDTLFVYKLSFPRLLSTGLLLLRSKSYMEFCASRKRLALTESDFLETWKFRFFLLCCLCSMFYSIAIVVKLLLELMITCTGLWLTFVILFLYTRLLSFPRLLSLGLLLLLWKSYMQFCASRKRLALTVWFFGDLII